jgi:hypothetical protein
VSGRVVTKRVGSRFVHDQKLERTEYISSTCRCLSLCTLAHRRTNFDLQC